MHDPLTSWKMSANKKASAQRQSLGGGGGGDGGRTPGRRGPMSPVAAGSPASGGGELEDESAGMNVDASFVRSRVREKLEGWDRGELLSVEGQVLPMLSMRLRVVAVRHSSPITVYCRGCSPPAAATEIEG